MNAAAPPSDASSPAARIRLAYDPSLLRSAGRLLSDRLAEALAAMESGCEVVLPRSVPEESVVLASAALDRPPSTDASDLTDRFTAVLEQMLPRGIALHHPRYVGHQVPPPIPLAGLFDVVGSITNQAMAIYEMGPWAMAVEQAMVRRLGGLVGWKAGAFSGLVTHGGSLANLTALLTARNVACPTSWREGLPRSGPPPAIVVHGDAHYCITRAAGMLGLGTSQVIRASLDDRRRIDVDRLDDMLRTLRKAGRPVHAVVACACSTPIGAFDPLEWVADVCRRHDVWLHVDAAHGGAALVSQRHRCLLAGIERSDSLILDAHKMLFMPALCTFLFYRDRRHAYAAFEQDAPYLFTDVATEEAARCRADFDGGLRTVECTKRAATFGLWGVWSVFGQDLFGDLVDTTFAMARTFHAKLTESPDFEPLYEPQANIVVFRHLPSALHGESAAFVSGFQRTLRQRLVESGLFYIVTTEIDGTTVLRATVMNPLTNPSDLDALLDVLRHTGREILDGVGDRPRV